MRSSIGWPGWPERRPRASSGTPSSCRSWRRALIRQSASEADALAEERRLLYVGITRARRHLVVSWAGLALARRPVRVRPSRFLAELRPGAVARFVPKAGAPVASFELSAADEPLLERKPARRRTAPAAGATRSAAAIAGGLAGLYWGVNSIPGVWLSGLRDKPEVERILNRLERRVDPRHEPMLPAMDPDYPYSTSDLEAIHDHAAWRRIHRDGP